MTPDQLRVLVAAWDVLLTAQGAYEALEIIAKAQPCIAEVLPGIARERAYLGEVLVQVEAAIQQTASSLCEQKG